MKSLLPGWQSVWGIYIQSPWNYFHFLGEKNFTSVTKVFGEFSDAQSTWNEIIRPGGPRLCLQVLMLMTNCCLWLLEPNVIFVCF